MKTLKIVTYILALIAGLFMGLTCNGQSFTAHKHTSDIGRCEVIQKQKTIGQKLRNKVKYARKRHHNEYFSEKERRRDMKRRGFKI